VPEFEDMCTTLKRSAAALRDAEVPFMLGGGLAAWARGGPESDHDLDYMVREEDAEQVLETLVAAGLRPERPPEDWLFKAWDGDVLVDIIFRPASGEVTEDQFARAEELEVLAVRMPVMALEDIFVTRLLALSEQHLELKPIVDLARAVREQVDWEAVRDRTNESPFAKAFFTLVEELGIVTAAPVG